ncbi:MAG TPA: hypothetical protein VFO58_06230, partial [Vicinamibacterales bacterium]|nr:hypothetical protein [Vicinamibacterales bacterium]
RRRLVIFEREFEKFYPPKEDDLARKADEAIALPGAQNAFRRMHLNQWTELSIGTESGPWIGLQSGPLCG